jgi:sigma-B regulation protein RsbU (phosphoserine phosphatase)
MKSPPLILIVDDNPTNVEIFQTRLAANKYNIITAMDGEAGLRMARDHLPDLILLDIMMPKMDGISVCRQIKSDPSLPFMPIIMVTAKAASKDIVAGLEAGGEEYLTKPVDHAALVSRVRSMLRIKELHDTVLEQSAQLKFQLETATKIQSLFWPKMPELKGGSHIWGISVPAAYVGGDFFDVIPLSDGSVLAYVADVSDKGVPAALIMAALSTKIRSEALLESEVEKLIESINNSTYRLMSEEGFFITIVLARYWPDSGKMQIVVGGHFPPLWIDESGIRKMPAPSGISLGVMPDARYEKWEIALSPGESVLFYSDGIIEARNENMELLGNGRLADLIANSKGPPWGKNIFEAVRLWQANTPAGDDMTLLEIWREKEDA